MRLLLVLFACIAATQALSYSSCNTYQYYCSHRFYVFPASSCYRYTIYFPSTWCSSSYYTKVLKVYPGDDCGKAGWSEKKVDDVVAEVRNCLNASLVKMISEMTSRKIQYLLKLKAIHDEFKARYTKYLTMYYQYKYCGSVYYIPERDAKIAAYCKKLQESRTEVANKYCSAIAAKVKSLKEYHAKIVKNAEDCLNTRNTKIAEYYTALQKKIDEYVSKFSTYHYAIVEKKASYYRATLASLFSSARDWWIHFKAYYVVDEYKYAEKAKVAALVSAYRAKLMAYKSKLITYYRCAYRCYMTNACLRFYKKSYYSSCKTLGTWYCYRSTYCATRYSILPFDYKIKFVTYKNLKTCDVDAAAGSITKVVKDLEEKRDAILRERAIQFVNWKNKWIGYHVEYKNAYEVIVKKSHDDYIAALRRRYLFCSDVITPEQSATLARVRRELDAKLKKVCEEYYAKLNKTIVDCVAKFNASQDEYKKSFDAYIAKIKAMFNACLEKRKVAIAAYKKKLEEMVAKQRVALDKRLYAAKTCHLNQYYKMIAFYHGDCYNKNYLVNWMNGCYIGDVLTPKCLSVLAQFDAHWRVQIPKLVENYACGYTCKVSAKCIPTYHCGSYFRWAYRLPTCSSYKFYYCL